MSHEVLGRNVTVRVEVFDESNNSENSAAQRPTSAYAWLAWDMRDPRVAHLRCFVPESKRWVKRDVTFTDQDPQTERGRTIGFVIASIFVEAGEPQSQPVVRVPQVPKINGNQNRRGFWLPLLHQSSRPATQRASEPGLAHSARYREYFG